MKDLNPAMLRMFYGYKLEDVGNPFYSHLLRWNNSNHIKKHFTESIKQGLKDYSFLYELEKRIPESFDSWDQLAKSQWLETTVFMSGYLLAAQGDRMGMANSIEGRYPFLDYRVIEFCSSLPADFRSPPFICIELPGPAILANLLRASPSINLQTARV